MKGRGWSAVLVGLLMIVPVGVVPATAPDARLPAPQVVRHLLDDLLLPLADPALSLPESLALRLPGVHHLPDRLHDFLSGRFVHHTKVVPAGTTETFTGPVTITEDWQVFGTVHFTNAQVSFSGNQVILVEDLGNVIASGATTFGDLDSDTLTGGTIGGVGGLDLQGTSSVPLLIRSTSLIPLATGDETSLADFSPVTLRWARLSGSALALATNNSAAVVENNAFFNNEIGILMHNNGFDADGIPVPSGGVIANATVNNNRYVGNQYGVLYNSGNAGGTVTRSEFQANIMGVFCIGTGDGPSRPHVVHNNFRNHYAEGYSGFRGVTIDLPPPGPGPEDVVIADSNCHVEDNYFDGDSTFAGGQDDIENNAPNPHADFATPASPVTPTVITATQTLGSPSLEGPLIVDNGGQLTITGILNANGNLWGSGTGGKLVANNVEVTNNGVLTIRNDNDALDGLRISSPPLRHDVVLLGSDFHALQWRNSAALAGWRVSDFVLVLLRTSGILVDDQQFTPSVTDGIFTNGDLVTFDNSVKATFDGNALQGAGGVISQLGTISFNDNDVTGQGAATTGVAGVISPVTADGNTLDNVGGAITGVLAAVTATDNVVTNSRSGVVVALASATSTGNKMRATDAGAVGLQGGLTSTNDVFDGGMIGVLSALATISISNALIAGQNVGVFSFSSGTGADASHTTTGSTFAYNAYAVASTGSALTVQNSNFRDNYLFSLFTMPPVLAGGQLAPASIACTNCFFFRSDDRSWSGPAITVTEAAVANPAPSLPWTPVVADGGDGDPGNDVVSLSGALSAPAVARAGGRLVADTVSLDGGDRFPIGGKTGGNAQGSTGQITLRDADLSNIRFIAANSTGSTVEKSAFSSSLELFEIASRGVILDCNRFDGVRGPVARFTRQLAGEAGLAARRNLLVDSGSLNLGFRGAEDKQAADVTDNTYAGGVPVDLGLGGVTILSFQGGLVNRIFPGHVEFHGNNLPSTTGLRDMTLRTLGSNLPDTINAEQNWWNDAAGPEVVWDPPGTAAGQEPRVTREGGAILWNVTDPTPGFEPFLADRAVGQLCLALFHFSPEAPTEILEASFRDRVIDPSGIGVGSRTWDFGDGTPAVATSEATIAHRFPDGGTYTVTLSVSTPDGRAGSVSRQVSVAHAAPLADFASSVVDELTPVQFTDASMHPNSPNDAPPAGWSYAWDFTGDGVADDSARNPSFRFADGGCKAVKLTVTDNDGRSASATKSVCVPHVPPVAGFSSVVADELTPVQFTDASTHPNSPTDAPPSGWTYAWNFNGEGSSSQRNPSFRFADGGSKAVTLTATDNDGRPDSESVTVTVPHVPPVADFGTTVVDPGKVQFTDESTHPNPADAPPSGWSYAWDFDGDGVSDSSFRNPFHDFGVPEGIFNICMTATDNDGMASAACKAVDVGLVNALPTAGFTVSPSTPVAGAEAKFTDASGDPDGTVTRIEVSWGDGTPNSEVSGSNVAGSVVPHTYASGGDYPVTWTVTDNRGAVASTTRVVHVCEPPGGVNLLPSGIHAEVCAVIRV